jgi:hypothetical protein
VSTPPRAADTADIGASLLQAYAASARVTEYLVERLDPALWRAKPPAPKLRPIAAVVAHMHNCGLVYLRRAAPSASVPAELDRFRVTPTAAVRALAAKRRAMVAVVGPMLGRRGRVGGCSHDPVRFLLYYMAHDAHHRGQIVWQARLLGHPITVDTMSGMWQWVARGRE